MRLVWFRTWLIKNDSVDGKTESLMHDIIALEFKDNTVVAIAHRLENVRHFDLVLFLNAGRVVECESPQLLLGTDSEFKKFFNSH